MQSTNIFIVDDSEIQLILLKKVLQNEGYEVKSFLAGNKLIEAIEDETPDLIISDIDMPVLNGFDLVKRVQNISTIPCFLISSKADKAIRQRVKAIGADGFIKKPFEYNSLITAINDLLLEYHSVDLIKSGHRQ